MAILILDTNKRRAAETAQKIAERTGGKIIYTRPGNHHANIIGPQSANDQDYYGGSAA